MSLTPMKFCDTLTMVLTAENTGHHINKVCMDLHKNRPSSIKQRWSAISCNDLWLLFPETLRAIVNDKLTLLRIMTFNRRKRKAKHFGSVWDICGMIEKRIILESLFWCERANYVWQAGLLSRQDQLQAKSCLFPLNVSKFSRAGRDLFGIDDPR